MPRAFVEKQARRTRPAPAPHPPRTHRAPAAHPPRTRRAAQAEALRVQKEAQGRIALALQATKQEFEAQVAAEEKRRDGEGDGAVASSTDGAAAGGERPTQEEGRPAGASRGDEGRDRRGAERERRYEDRGDRGDRGDRRRDDRGYDDRYERRRHD